MKTGMILAMILMAVLPGLPESDMRENVGQKLYNKHCKLCHGKRGTRSLSGAPKLRESTLTDAEYRQIIRDGKDKMPAWKDELTDGEIQQIVTYIKTFKI